MLAQKPIGVCDMKFLKFLLLDMFHSEAFEFLLGTIVIIISVSALSYFFIHFAQ